MQISLSAGKGWFLFFKFHLYAVLMLFYKKILQNTVSYNQILNSCGMWEIVPFLGWESHLQHN